MEPRPFKQAQLGVLYVCLLTLLLFPPGLLSASEKAKSPVELSLTESEKNWLANHPTLRLAVDIDWPPFEFIDAQKQYRGMAADIIRLVEQRLGIHFQIDPNRPWSQMVEGVKNRDLDLFSCVVKTPQRALFVSFTKPYISSPMVIFTRDDEDFIDGIPALLSHPVAVVKNYASHDLLAKNHPELPLTLVDTTRQGLEQVSDGRSFAFIGNLAVASQVMREVGLTNLKVSGQTPYRFELAMAVRNDWPELLPILQKALDSIDPKQRDQIYNHWIRVKYHNQVDYRIVAATLAGSLLILITILLWNRRLRSEIQQRKQAQKKLEEEGARHQAILDHAVEGIITISDQGIIVAANPAAGHLFGYTMDEMLGNNISLIIPSPHRENHNEYLARYLRTRQARILGISQEVEGLTKEGEAIPIQLSISVIDLEDRTLFTGILHDLTEQKKTDRLKNEFVSTVSHELRTPLTSIYGGLKMVLAGVTGPLPDKTKRLLTLAYNNSERLNLLINDILDVQKIESGLSSFQLKPLDPATLLRQAVEENRAYGVKLGVTYTVMEPLPDHLRIKGDRARLFQVLANLLSNAAKYSQAGQKVEIALVEERPWATFSVTDFGSGIPASFQPRVFQKFAQADSSDTRQKGGTGLGLSITKALVENHQGTIDFKTEPGKGSTFFFRLPLLNMNSNPLPAKEE